VKKYVDDHVVKDKPLSNHPSNVKAKMTLLKFLNHKSFWFDPPLLCEGMGGMMSGLVLIHPSYVICVMNKQHSSPKSEFWICNKSSFKVGDWVALKKKLASNKSSLKVGDG
jgi:hypothetical protein